MQHKGFVRELDLSHLDNLTLKCQDGVMVNDAGGAVEVVHCKRQPFDVYIGRPSKWGNPFHMGGDPGSRTEVIAMYERWIQEQPDLLTALPELEGKVLECWCAPRPCHGDVLARLVAQLGRRS